MSGESLAGLDHQDEVSKTYTLWLCLSWLIHLSLQVNFPVILRPGSVRGLGRLWIYFLPLFTVVIRGFCSAQPPTQWTSSTGMSYFIYLMLFDGHILSLQENCTSHMRTRLCTRVMMVMDLFPTLLSLLFYTASAKRDTGIINRPCPLWTAPAQGRSGWSGTDESASALLIWSVFLFLGRIAQTTNVLWGLFVWFEMKVLQLHVPWLPVLTFIAAYAGHVVRSIGLPPPRCLLLDDMSENIPITYAEAYNLSRRGIFVSFPLFKKLVYGANPFLKHHFEFWGFPPSFTERCSNL